MGERRVVQRNVSFAQDFVVFHVHVAHVMDLMVVAPLPVQKFYVGILLPRHDVNEMLLITKYN